MKIEKPNQKRTQNMEDFIAGRKNQESLSADEFQYLNIKLDKNFHTAFKIYCLANCVTMQEQIRTILLEWSKSAKGFGKF